MSWIESSAVETFDLKQQTEVGSDQISTVEYDHDYDKRQVTVTVPDKEVLEGADSGQVVEYAEQESEADTIAHC